MSKMILQYTAPEIYILGSTNKIQELNVEGLFISPAGRELMKQPPTQYQHKNGQIKHRNTDIRKTLPTINLLNESPYGKSVDNKHTENKLSKETSGKVDDDEEAHQELLDTVNGQENLYKQEMNLLLGFDCILEDDCRCLDCQSSYFDYTEEDDIEESLDYFPSLSGACRRHSDHNTYCCIQ